MKIYLDLVMIINFVFDFVLLSSVNYILRRNTKVLRLLFSSLIGSLTLFILFIKMNNFILLLYKFFVSVVMLFVAFGYKDIKYMMKNILYFYLVSMLMGGGIYFLNSQFNYSSDGFKFTSKGLYNSYGVMLILGMFLFFKYMKSLKGLKTDYSNYYKCKIYFDEENKLELNAFLDTGNKLEDPYSKRSIVLIHEDRMVKSKDIKPIYVPYNSLNNHGLLTCYKAERIEIMGKSFANFLVGVSEENFFIDGIDCIINSKVMEGLR